MFLFKKSVLSNSFQHITFGNMLLCLSNDRKPASFPQLDCDDVLQICCLDLTTVCHNLPRTLKDLFCDF